MCHSQAEILRQEASVTKQSCPQLDTNDAEDEEDEEAEQQDVAQHGQRVQQQRDEDAHACGGRSHAGGARLHLSANINSCVLILSSLKLIFNWRIIA